MNARRFLVSQAWPRTARPSRPAGSRSAAATRLARCIDNKQVGHVAQRGAASRARAAGQHPARGAVADHPALVGPGRASEVEVAVGADDREPRLGLAQPLDEVGHARRLEQRRVGTPRSPPPPRRPSRPPARGGAGRRGRGRGACGPSWCRARGPRPRSRRRRPRATRPRRRSRAARSARGPSRRSGRPGALGTTPRSRPSHIQRTSGAATWLKPASSRATSRSTSCRGVSLSHGNTIRSPRSPQSMTVASSSSRRTVTGPGRVRDAPHRGQQQRGQLGVAERIGAHGEPVVVVEQPQRRLLAGAQEMRFVGDAAQARHEVGPAPAHPGHDVEQARPPVEQRLGALDGDVARRRGLAQPQPRLGQRAQRLVALGRRHAGPGSSAPGRTRGTRRAAG